MPPQEVRASTEDLTVMIRRQSQRAQNLFGEDKNKRRRTAISRDMENLVKPEIIAHKKKTALERTLKVYSYDTMILKIIKIFLALSTVNWKVFGLAKFLISRHFVLKNISEI